MNISVDGGGLCLSSHKQFGNYTFTHNIIKALAQYDKANNYVLYTFCDVEIEEGSKLNIKKLLPRTAWMKARVSLEELLQPKDIFLALNQALPLYTQAKKIIFTHGLSFLQYPDLYKNDYARLKKQLDEYVQKADIIIVSSQKIKNELLELQPKGTIEVLPFGISHQFTTSIIQERKPFFIFVGMNHPIKNIPFLIDVFKKFISKKEFSHFKLCLVGPFKEYESENIQVCGHMSAEELKNLYQQATAYIAPSLYESFNYPVLEALSQNTPVIGLETAIIPEMKSFVNIVTDGDQMLQMMQKVASGECKKFDLKSLQKQFSWEIYVKKLISLY